MAAMAVAAGAMVVGGLIQAYNAEQARGAEKKRLEEIKRLYEKLKPPNYDYSIEDPPELHAKALQQPQFSSAQAAPQWNLDKLDPEDLKVVQKFTPQVAPLIMEEQPQLIEKTPEMKEGLDAQKSALRKFMSIGEGDGYDPEHAQRVQEARRRAQSEAQSRGASIMQDFERRGLGGSGMELAAKMGASSQAMDRNAQLGLAAETDAYRNQLNALAQGANIGGQVYSQEQGTQARNADIINAFNQRMSKRHQDWEQMRADTLNAADLRNIQEAQRIADHNTMGRNDAARQHQQRMDDLTKFNYAAQQQERNRQDDLSKWKYNAAGQERAYGDAREILQKKWRQDNVDRMNNFKDKNFANANAIISGKAGMAQALNQSDIGRAQDRNAAIQGLSNLGMMYGMQKSNQAHQDDMWSKYGDQGYRGGN